MTEIEKQEKIQKFLQEKVQINEENEYTDKNFGKQKFLKCEYSGNCFCVHSVSVEV